ncbi:MAG: LamG-like jellyroll fold domain-containing protein [Kiritimatiellales bacterium]
MRSNYMLPIKKNLLLPLCVLFYTALFGFSFEFSSVQKPLQLLLHLSFENDNYIEYSFTGAAAYADYPEFAEGYQGRGLSVFRKGENVMIADVDNLDKEQGTLSFWYRPESLDLTDIDLGLFLCGTEEFKNPNVMKVLITRTGQLRFEIDHEQACLTSVRSWIPGEWVHIACLWNYKEGLQIYVNGEKVRENPKTWTPRKNGQIHIGRSVTWRGEHYARGVIDDVKVYNRPLTAQEVKTEFAGQLKTARAPLQEKTVQDEVPKRLFKLSFLTGNEADESAGASRPLTIQNIKAAPGLIGNGAQLDKNSQLDFSGKDNISSRKGSVAMWIKLNWEPEGNGWHISRAGADAEGERHTVFTAEAGSQRLRFLLSNFIRLKWSSGNDIYASGNRQIMKDTWHHYVITWDSDSGLARVYLDGKFLCVSSIFEPLRKPITKFSFAEIDGVLDEVSIYNYALSHADVMKIYYQEAGLNIDLLDYAAFAGKDNSIRLKFINGGDQQVDTSFQMMIHPAGSSAIQTEEIPVTLDAGKECVIPVNVAPPVAGLYRLNLLNSSGRQIRSYEIVAIDQSPAQLARPPLAPGEAAAMTLIEQIDCTADIGPEKYRDDGHVSVQYKTVGAYREALNEAFSGFAYRMEPLKNPGRPHWLEIYYPDDAARTFMVAVFQEKDGHVSAQGLDTVGIISGGDHLLSGTMQMKRLLFWPDSTNIMVGCYNYHKYEGQNGPALAEIRLYENAGPLPERQVELAGGLPRRTIGLWDEDPSMGGTEWFNLVSQYDQVRLNNFWETKWNRTIDYLNYSGQNLWHMLVTSYEGDTALNSNQISASWRMSSRGWIPGWADLGALMLNRNGTVFYAALNSQTTYKGGKMPGAIAKLIPEEYLRTKNTMEEIISGDNPLIVDCIAADDYFADNYDPLNPVVQKAFETQVRLYAEKFGQYSNFGGVNFLPSNHDNRGRPYFADLQQGYSDYNIQRFEADTGINVDVDASLRRRFSARYDWLMQNAREEWINWRCKKFREFYKHLAGIIRSYNPDAKLLISLAGYNGAFAMENRDWPLSDDGLNRYWKECGIDFALYKDDSDIALLPVITPESGRIRPHRFEATYRYDCFNPAVDALVSSHKERGKFISYFSNLEFLPWHEIGIPSYWWSFGAWEGRVNGPIHAFANVVPSQEYMREYMADTLANQDAHRIIHGWWGCPDNGGIDEFSKFYASYRSIPAFDFMDLPGAEDPVRVRYYNAGNQSWIYFVNRLPNAMPCVLRLTDNAPLRATISNREFTVNSSGEFEITLAPFEVLCLTRTQPIMPENFACRVPAEMGEMLRTVIEKMQTAYSAMRVEPEEAAILEALLRKLNLAYIAGRYAEVGHLLQSIPAQKIKAAENITRSTVDFSAFTAGAVSAVAGWDITVKGGGSAVIAKNGAGVNVLRLNSIATSDVAMLSSQQTFKLSDAWSVSVDFAMTTNGATGPVFFGVYNAAVVDADGLTGGEAGNTGGTDVRGATAMMTRPTGNVSLIYTDNNERKNPAQLTLNGGLDVTGATRYTYTVECDGVNVTATLKNGAETMVSTTRTIGSFGSNISADALKFALGDVTNNDTKGWNADVYSIETATF